VELYVHSPDTPSWRCAQLSKKHRDNFTFTLTVVIMGWCVSQAVRKLSSGGRLPEAWVSRQTS
jgi:hypothetical protein